LELKGELKVRTACFVYLKVAADLYIGNGSVSCFSTELGKDTSAIHDKNCAI